MYMTSNTFFLVEKDGRGKWRKTRFLENDGISNYVTIELGRQTCLERGGDVQNR